MLEIKFTSCKRHRSAESRVRKCTRYACALCGHSILLFGNVHARFYFISVHAVPSAVTYRGQNLLPLHHGKPAHTNRSIYVLLRKYYILPFLVHSNINYQPQTTNALHTTSSAAPMPKDRFDITYRCTQPLYTVLLANALYRGGYVHPIHTNWFTL